MSKELPLPGKHPQGSLFSTPSFYVWLLVGCLIFGFILVKWPYTYIFTKISAGPSLPDTWFIFWGIPFMCLLPSVFKAKPPLQVMTGVAAYALIIPLVSTAALGISMQWDIGNTIFQYIFVVYIGFTYPAVFLTSATIIFQMFSARISTRGNKTAREL